MTYHYTHQRPALTADLIVLAIGPDNESLVLLIERGEEPYAGWWAIPGGHVEPGETLEAAARRELLEETGIQTDIVEQIGTFGDPGRDPRGWVVSVAFATVVDKSLVNPHPGSDARNVAWFSLAALPEQLAFDHRAILDAVCAKIDEPFDQTPSTADEAVGPTSALAFGGANLESEAGL
jgi:8-oxo-dGTP diphosphatase